MWRSHLARSLHQHRNQPESRFLQLATMGCDQRPRNRTVVFRGFLENCDRLKDCLKIVTDERSQKIAQIDANPWAEINWYFTKTRSQFRILGKSILINSECSDLQFQKARSDAWKALSDPARMQFAWGHPRMPRIDFAHIAPPDPEQPLPSFCLLLIEPIEVDRLELRGNPQNRWLYLLDEQGNWAEQEVNP
ncbi:Npun_F5749 family FMN-dependent PPOX-type flavoprotein [Pseudanabaena sp. UWO310]|uniref:Npun_F5749 family FMN-dependent PPOX-type flavoprotein n=1 Tax=Pseudanabaena sp. UWO310 TaxID=2480795 RepID=UPI001159FA64|nr:Npun_F5749 family FMN-dependent PPOX-type flavoprotein [Pseudanabaena sp. UWO310]TYQ27938.1 pyridoxamine 5'-phosphate oxidase [Pseudanabaena sp. UWO310]